MNGAARPGQTTGTAQVALGGRASGLYPSIMKERLQARILMSELRQVRSRVIKLQHTFPKRVGCSNGML
jgi:hypothetical protein